jgi:hypothetical protein
MLEALISFMPTDGMGAIGALDWTAEERKKLAVEVSGLVFLWVGLSPYVTMHVCPPGTLEPSVI